MSRILRALRFEFGTQDSQVIAKWKDMFENASYLNKTGLKETFNSSTLQEVDTLLKNMLHQISHNFFHDQK